MNQTIIIQNKSPSETPPPNCPHCQEPLPGFSKNSDMSFSEVMQAAAIISVTIIMLISVVSGFIDKHRMCKTFGEKRWHYILPLNPLMCQAGRWLNNEEFLTEQDYIDYREKVMGK